MAAALGALGLACDSYPGHLLYEPAQVAMPAGFHGGHWGTLMPFLKACERSAPPPARPLPPPAAMRPPERWPASASLASLGLAAPRSRADGSHGRDWATPMLAHWDVGEAAAVSAMSAFVRGGLP